MARKKFPAVPLQKKPSPGIARGASAKPAPHARLVHGFLVRLPARSTNPARVVNRAFATVASVKAHVQRPSNAKYEGPTDDATFH